MTYALDIEGSDLDLVETGSGLLVPRHAVTAGRPKGVDLFCGCGGFSLGMIEAGFEVVAAADNDPLAALTYLTNLGTYPVQIHRLTPEDDTRLQQAWSKWLVVPPGKRNLNVVEEEDTLGVWRMPVVSGSARPRDVPGVSHFFFGDIRHLTGRRVLDAIGLGVGDLDIVFGGPPCQGFSTMGKREVVDPRNSLVFEFARLVLELRPKAICMENVPGMLSMVTPEGLSVVEAFARTLADGGFAPLDALRRSLIGHPERRGALRGQANVQGGKPAGTQARTRRREPEQQDLLTAARGDA